MSNDDVAELVELRERYGEERRARMIAEGKLLRIHGRGPQRTGAAVFRKRPRGRFDESLCTVVEDMSGDRYVLKWTNAARWALLPGGRGSAGVIDGEVYASLPDEFKAEGWWHLCAELGLSEAIVRAIYVHPEDGQPSAVAGVPGVATRGPSVFCQSQHDPEEP